MSNERLNALRAKMAEKGIDVYYVPTDDFHGSEYVGDYFKCRSFLTGFTGSAGVALVTKDDAGLWTDGRYFLQAERQLEGSGFTLYRAGEPGVPTLTEWIGEKLPEGGVLGYDGRVVTAARGKAFHAVPEKKQGRIEAGYDLVGEIWPDRPALSHEKAWILEECYAGESVSSKLSRIREAMGALGANFYLLSALEDIAWTLNLRGNDVKHCPVVLSYLAVTEKGCIFYVQDEALTPEVRAYLEENHVSTAPYGDVYAVAESLGKQGNVRVLLSLDKVNDRLYRLLSGTKRIEKTDPTVRMKAIKNPTELMNIRAAHVKDGVAMVKWIYWLKNAIGREKLTEISVADKLEALRRSMKHCVDLSFETIAAYKENGAIVHYSATEETNRELKPESFLLCDSGGHYLEGSTDITRTIALGPLTDEEREMFTLVLKGHLSLLPLKFHYGCSGLNFDLLVREPLWERGLDYRHGTGHGVGYLLAVHEAPNGFRYRVVPERDDNTVLEEGMVTTDEPGIYLDGKFGVRIESELAARKGEETEYGQFMYFENLTFCPIDLEAVVPEMLTEKERETLNSYHETVYATIAPYLTDDEREWLREETRRI